MLTKLDRYIIQKYLSTFLFTVLIFSMIAGVIDFSDKIDDFIEEPVTMKQILLDFYVNFFIWINGLLLPLYALIAVIFFTSRMASNSEIISILNAGVSYRRLMRPYLIAAFLIAGFHLLSNHYLIPIGNVIRLDFERQYVFKNNEKGKSTNVHLITNEEEKTFIKYYRKKDSTALGLRIERYDKDELKFVLKAKKAIWDSPPNNWNVYDFETRTFDEGQETYTPMEKDTSMQINMNPNDFVRYLNQKETMNTPELVKFINFEQSRGVGNTKVYEVELHRRTADSFTIIILTLIGVSVASRKVRGGIGLHLAIGVALGGSYVFLSRFSTTLATNASLPALIGVWIPNLVFTCIAFYLLLKAQR